MAEWDSEWVPVAQISPPEGELVLVYAPARGVDMANIEESDRGELLWMWAHGGYGIEGEVTHWMYLPPGPDK